MFNLKNTECQSKFHEITTNTRILSNAFRKDENLNVSGNRFMKRLHGIIHSCFKKVRIGAIKENPKINEMFEKRKSLKKKDDEESKTELKKVEEYLAEMCAEDNLKKIENEVRNINCEEGGVNSGALWKLKKKLNPKSRDPPTAIQDEAGNMVSSSEKIKGIT